MADAPKMPEMPNFGELFKGFDELFKGFDALFDGGFGPKEKTPEEKKPSEKSPIWSAKMIDGKRYVSLEQVAELLEMNDVLPAVRKGLERRL